MDVFLMIRRQNITLFVDAKESTTIYELKKIVEGITKRAPEDQRLHKDDQILEDTKTLGDCGFTSGSARAQAPGTIGLAFIIDEDCEALAITAYSNPPELPDVMKPQESSTSNAAEQPVS